MKNPRIDAPVPARTATGFRLALDPLDAGALKRHPLFAGKPVKRLRQVDVYFDTPDLQLWRNGLALRLRRTGGRWLQALTAGEHGAAGLHEHDEWEFPLPTGNLDQGMLAGTPFGKLPPEACRALVPAFTVKVMHTSWEVTPKTSGRTEIALDQGVLSCRGLEQPICEVEFELLEGAAGLVFDAAATLQEGCSLRPDSDSKAECGFRLLRGEPPHPVRAERIHLERGLTLPMALRRIARSSLSHLHANETGVLASNNGEFVHQTRVALRRLRSALKFAGAHGAPPGGIPIELKWLSGALGPARDWDVLLRDTLPPALRAYGDAVEAGRIARAARKQLKASFIAARQALGSQRYFALLREISRWLSAPLPQGAGTLAAAFAAKRIGKHHKRLLRAAADLAEQTPQQCHRVRIDAKHLRYAVEHFGSLFHRKGVRRYLRTLSALQDVLGSANDAAAAQRLLAQMSLSEAPATFIGGWLAARGAGDLARAQNLVARLGRRKRFWTRKYSAAPN